LLESGGGGGSLSSERELSAARGWLLSLEALSRDVLSVRAESWRAESWRAESWAARGGGGAGSGGGEHWGSGDKLLSTIAAKLLVSCDGSGRAGFGGAF
jgi:hypothetical protein